jgi:hypothetical protein
MTPDYSPTGRGETERATAPLSMVFNLLRYEIERLHAERFTLRSQRQTVAIRWMEANAFALKIPINFHAAHRSSFAKGSSAIQRGCP